MANNPFISDETHGANCFGFNEEYFNSNFSNSYMPRFEAPDCRNAILEIANARKINRFNDTNYATLLANYCLNIKGSSGNVIGNKYDGNTGVLIPPANNTDIEGNMMNYPIFYSDLCENEMSQVVIQNPTSDVAKLMDSFITNFCTDRATPFKNMTSPSIFNNIGDILQTKGQIPTINDFEQYNFTIAGFNAAVPISIDNVRKLVSANSDIIGLYIENVNSENTNVPVMIDKYSKTTTLILNKFAKTKSITGEDVPIYKYLLNMLLSETSDTFISIRSKSPQVPIVSKNGTAELFGGYSSELFGMVSPVIRERDSAVEIDLVNVSCSSTSVFTSGATKYELPPTLNRKYWSDLAINDQYFSFMLLTADNSKNATAAKFPDVGLFNGARIASRGTNVSKIINACSCHMDKTTYDSFYQSVISNNDRASINGNGGPKCIFPGCGSSNFPSADTLDSSGKTICKAPLCSQSVIIEDKDGKMNINSATINQKCFGNKNTTNDTTNNTTENRTTNYKNNIHKLVFDHSGSKFGLVIGLVIGCIIIVGAIVILAVFGIYKYRKHKKATTL